MFGRKHRKTKQAFRLTDSNGPELDQRLVTDENVRSELPIVSCNDPDVGHDLDQSLVTGENVRAELPLNSSEIEVIRAKRKLVSSETTAATTSLQTGWMWCPIRVT